MNRKVWLALLAVGVLCAAGLYLLVFRNDNTTPDPSETQRPATGPEIVVAYSHEPPSLSPLEESAATRDWLRPVLPTLLTFDPQGRPIPMVARGSPDRDGNTIVFDLSSRAVWSDGDPIDADDIRFTWQVFKHLHPYDLIEDVRARAGGVEIVMREAYSDASELFSFGTYILPKHVLEKAFQEGTLDAALKSGPPVSGGPFKVESFTQGLEMTLVPNERWWGERPLAERVRVQVLGEFATALELYQRGRVDVISTVTQLGIESRLAAIGARHNSSFGYSWWELVMNTSRPALDTVEERRVVAGAVDREGIFEAFVREQGRLLNALSPGRAEVFAELESGRGSGRLIFSAPNTDELARPVQRAIQTGLSSSGIESDPTNPDPVRLHDWLSAGEFDLALIMRRTPPSGWLPRRFGQAGPLNYSRLSGITIDDAAIASQLPVLPLFEVKGYLAHGASIRGAAAHAGMDGPFWNLQDWLKQPRL